MSNRYQRLQGHILPQPGTYEYYEWKNRLFRVSSSIVCFTNVPDDGRYFRMEKKHGYAMDNLDLVGYSPNRRLTVHVRVQPYANKLDRFGPTKAVFVFALVEEKYPETRLTDMLTKLNEAVVAGDSTQYGVEKRYRRLVRCSRPAFLRSWVFPLHEPGTAMVYERYGDDTDTEY